MTIVDFLTARLDEDAAAIPSATDPARARLEVTTKRRFINLWTWSSAGTNNAWPQREAELKILASVYAGHPDYQPDWA